MSEQPSCAMIKDIAPLYEAGKVSADTKGLIEEHLAECGECGNFYESMGKTCISHKSEADEAQRYRSIAKRIKRRRLCIAGVTAGMILVLLFVYTFMFQFIMIDGNCMSPVLNDGEWYVINKAKYKLSDPKLNDIIVYKQNDIYYAARIVGVPGINSKLDADSYLVASEKGRSNAEAEKISRCDIIGKALVEP